MLLCVLTTAGVSHRGADPSASTAFLHVKAFTYLPYRALAKPVRLPADSDTISLASTSSAPVDGSFAEWQKWEERKKRELKAASRLAKMKFKDGRLVKEDGTPLLQQTKRWPALLKCLLLTDLGRELKEETGYMIRRREPGLLDRRNDLEEAMGKPRPMGESEKEWGFEGGACDYGRGDSLEMDLRRLKEGKSVGLGAKSKVGADGSLLLPALAKNGLPHQEEGMQRRYSREEEGTSLLRAEEGRVERWEKDVQQRRIKTAVQGKESWWNSLSKGFGHKGRKKAAVSTFQQLERPDDGYHPRPPPSDVDPDPTTSLPAPPRIISHPPTRPSHAPRRPSAPLRPLELNLPPPLALSDDVILDSMAGMGPIVAPHALGSPTRTSAPVARTTNSRRHSADPRLGSSTPSTTNSHTYTQRAPSFFSPDASGLRHPSIAASNPPRSLWSPSRAEPPLTDFAPPPRAWRRHSVQVEMQSERSLQLIATEESRVSRGLPPGAGPRAGGGGGGGARAFVFEEY